ncbi:hypothetical protein E1B28_004093 [Marasmius oreades]|uniref:Pentatricopeptide repeat-containing protein n=1 Tax=Marasmius oreades TaxID=181124 RepID=A0A9P7UXV7_9AGAR|nr:uncharacterized protein E1B28_004093 [Marasmius oreades]KAG7096679.1 hypothetical protein E1B28_004093 [Marasmius oreades]
MLKAFSLGSLSSLTTHQRLRKCLLRHTSQPAKITRFTSKALPRLRGRHNADGASFRNHPPPIPTQKTSQVGSVKENGVVAVEVSGVEDPKTKSSRPVDAQERNSLRPVKDRIFWNREHPIVREHPMYISGKSNHHLPITPLYGGKFWNGKKFLPRHLQHQPTADADTTTPKLDTENSSVLSFYQNLHIIANTQSVSEAWKAYSNLLNSPAPEGDCGRPKIPFQHLHRLCRLFASRHPKTRTQFLRLLSVLCTLRRTGGIIHLHEWNALIAHAGEGWRRNRPEEFKLALDVFNEMSLGLPPGSTFSPSDHPPLDTSQPVQPDIYSYNTLLSIAAKTLYPPTLGRATTLMRSSGLPPDRITHLSLLTFFSATTNLSGVRSTLHKMRQQGLELGLDGVTSCIWAYNLAGRMDIVDLIYRVLKHNSISDPRLRNANFDSDRIADSLRTLETEGILIPEEMIPNEITFTEMIQALAYHGDLHAAINVFLDMLSSDNIEVGAPLVRGEDGLEYHTKYSPTYAVFRGLFLGFSRHGTTESTSQTWTLDNLREIYRDFMAFPEIIHPSPLLLYWILLAFDKTTGHDINIIRKVWLEMEARFTDNWGGRMGRLRTIIFSEDAQTHLEHIGFRVTPPASEEPGEWV